MGAQGNRRGSCGLGHPLGGGRPAGFFVGFLARPPVAANWPLAVRIETAKREELSSGKRAADRPLSWKHQHDPVGAANGAGGIVLFSFLFLILECGDSSPL